MTNPFDEFADLPKKRTTFLTVLCILTFIGSGFGLISNTYSFFTAEDAAANFRTEAEKVKKTESKGPKDEGKIFAEKIVSTVSDAFTPERIKKMALSELSGALLCLLGAFLMWRLNKKGYLLYVAGVLLGMVIPFVLFGNNLLAIFMSVISGFIGLVFCVLYALNLKDMK